MTKLLNNIWLLLVCLFIIAISTIGMVVLSLHLMSKPSTFAFVMGLASLLLTIFSASFWNMLIFKQIIKIIKNKLNKN